jgi:hypothetical protein
VDPDTGPTPFQVSDQSFTVENRIIHSSLMIGIAIRGGVTAPRILFARSSEVMALFDVADEVMYDAEDIVHLSP